MTCHPTIPMMLMQPDPRVIVEEIYEAGEALLPKQEGEFLLLHMQPIYSKDSQAFQRGAHDLGPTVWDTTHFKAGPPAPGPCVVLWTRVIRKGDEKKILTPAKPPLIL